MQDGRSQTSLSEIGVKASAGKEGGKSSGAWGRGRGGLMVKQYKSKSNFKTGWESSRTIIVFK